MQSADSQREHTLLYERYRRMSDEELEQIAAAAYELTDLARECLRYEIASRNLSVRLSLDHKAKGEPASDRPIATVPQLSRVDRETMMRALPPEDDGFVPDDRDLAWVYTAYEFDELLQVKYYLNKAHIECFFGDAKLRDIRALPATFDGDMDVRVWAHQLYDARAVLTACVPGFGAQQEPPDGRFYARSVNLMG